MVLLDSASTSWPRSRRWPHFLQRRCRACCTPSVGWSLTCTGAVLSDVSPLGRRFDSNSRMFSGRWTGPPLSCSTPAWRTWSERRSSSARLRLIRLITTCLQRGWTTPRFSELRRSNMGWGGVHGYFSPTSFVSEKNEAVREENILKQLPLICF